MLFLSVIFKFIIELSLLTPKRQQQMVKLNDINLVLTQFARFALFSHINTHFIWALKACHVVIFIQSSVKNKVIGTYNMTQYTHIEKLRHSNP